MSYGVQFINNDGVVIIDDTQVGYFISETGTLTPDVTNYNEGSGSQNVCAYYLDNTYELDATEAATATVWNSSTTYAVGALVTRPSEPDYVYSCLHTPPLVSVTSVNRVRPPRASAKSLSW